MTTTTTQPTETLRRLHAALVAPYEWSSTTIEVVAEILAEGGYRMPSAAFVDDDGYRLEAIDVDDERLDAFRPALPAVEVEAARVARTLRSEAGENPEYDRALVEMVTRLSGRSHDDDADVARLLGIGEPFPV
jgi:hypothetical protein